MIKIDNLTVNLQSGPSPLVAAMLKAVLALGQPDEGEEVGGDVPKASGPEAAPAPFPAIAAAWPGMAATYAGLSRGVDGEPDGHLVLIDYLPPKKLNWEEAKAWAASLGDGARLPTRSESALLYANLKDKFETDDVYWIGEQYSELNAFGQNFGNGYQSYYDKEYEARCRAVRRLVL